MNSNVFYVFLLMAFVCVSSVTAKAWKDCGSKLSTINSIKITGCTDESTECIFKRNSNASIEIDFTATSPVTKLNTVVHGIMMGVPVPFPLPNPDACENNGLTCPLSANSNYVYSTHMPVLKSYPKVALEVQWELQTASKEDLICILITTKIQ